MAFAKAKFKKKAKRADTSPDIIDLTSEDESLKNNTSNSGGTSSKNLQSKSLDATEQKKSCHLPIKPKKRPSDPNMTVDVDIQLDDFKIGRPNCEKIDVRFMCKTNPTTARLLCFGHEVTLTIPSEGDDF